MYIVKRLAPVLLMVAVAVLAAGCVKVIAQFDVADDGSGSVQYDIQVDRDGLEQMADFGGDILGAIVGLDEGTGDLGLGVICEELLAEVSNSLVGQPGSDTPAGVSVESTTDAGACSAGVRAVWDAAAADAFLADLNSDESITLRRLPEGGWRFESLVEAGSDASADPEDLDLGEGLGILEGIDLSMLEILGLEPPGVQLSVTLPGEAVEHNADSVSGSTFRWDFSLTDGDASIFAETKPKGSSNVVWIIVAVVAVVVVAAAVWIGVAASRRRGDGQPM